MTRRPTRADRASSTSPSASGSLDPLLDRFTGLGRRLSRRRHRPSGSAASSTSPATRPAGPSTGCWPSRSSAPSPASSVGCSFSLCCSAALPDQARASSSAAPWSASSRPNMYLYQRAYDRSRPDPARAPRRPRPADHLAWRPVSASTPRSQQVARNTDGPAGRGVLPRAAGDADRHRPRRGAARARPSAPTCPSCESFVHRDGPGRRLRHPDRQVLRVQSREMRIKRRQRAEEKAQKVPVKITLPADLLHPAVPVHRRHGPGGDPASWTTSRP